MSRVSADPPANVILIGMPGVGKSTVGVVLAKRLGCDFLDTDLLIQRGEGLRLQELIQRHGIEGFKDLEARYLLRLSVRETVVATGGSAVYREAAMARLRGLGLVVFLQIGLEALQARLENLDERGVVRMPGQSVAAVFAERLPLYRRHAQITIVTDGLTPEQVVNAAWEALGDEAGKI